MTSLVLRTFDDLLTVPGESTPFTDQDVLSLWEEIDVSTTRVAAGGTLGTIAVSQDSGGTWALKGGASVTPLVRIIISRYNPAEFHAVYEDGYYISLNGASSWARVLAAEPDEIFTDISLSHTRNMLATTMGVRNVGQGVVGALMTGTSVECPKILSIVADIREDKFYCYNAAGQCYNMATGGATSFTAVSTLPAPTQAMIRGAERDGAIPGLIYVANGTNGLWKSLDGYATPGGWKQLRKPSILGAGVGPWYMVGLGDLVPPPTLTESELMLIGLDPAFYGDVPE